MEKAGGKVGGPGYHQIISGVGIGLGGKGAELIQKAQGPSRRDASIRTCSAVGTQGWS